MKLRNTPDLGCPSFYSVWKLQAVDWQRLSWRPPRGPQTRQLRGVNARGLGPATGGLASLPSSYSAEKFQALDLQGVRSALPPDPSGRASDHEQPRDRGTDRQEPRGRVARHPTHAGRPRGRCQQFCCDVPGQLRSPAAGVQPPQGSDDHPGGGLQHPSAVQDHPALADAGAGVHPTCANPRIPYVFRRTWTRTDTMLRGSEGSSFA